MSLANYKAGQPVEAQALRGASASFNGQQGYLLSPAPDEHGLYTIAFELKPATKSHNAVRRDLKVGEAKIKVLSDQKPPRNFKWHFAAKNYRYAAQLSGPQPQPAPSFLPIDKPAQTL